MYCWISLRDAGDKLMDWSDSARQSMNSRNGLGTFSSAGCATGEFGCSGIGQDIEETMFYILLSAGLTAATYVLYRKRESRERQRLAA